MAIWTQEKRDATPVKNFGEPQGQKFPIEDQDDVDSAAKLIGKATNPEATKKRIIRIAKRLKLTIPESWTSEAEPAAMGVDMSDDDLRSALMDALGDQYPGNPYSMYSGGIWIRDVYQGSKQVVFDYGDDTLRQAYEISDAGAITLIGVPEEVSRRTVYVAEPAEMGNDSAEFELGPAPAEFAAEDFVFYEGKIFQSGNYPRQEIEMTDADVEAACRNFAPVPIKDTHHEHQSIFAGRLGQLENIWNKGGELFGRLKVPAWLKDALPGHAPKVSVEINRKTKKLDAIALLNFGQVPDAQVQAAFAAFAAFEGKRYSGSDAEKMQTIHDMTAGLGAACSAQMGAKRSSKDASVIQKLHDLSVDQGATCEPAKASMEAVVTVPINPATAQTATAKEKQMHPLIKGLRAFFGKKPDAAKEIGLTDDSVKLLNSDDPADQAQFMAALPANLPSEVVAEMGAIAEPVEKPVTEPAKAEESEETKRVRAEFESRLAATETETKNWRASFEASCANTLKTEKALFADQFCRPQLDVRTGTKIVLAKPPEREVIEALFEDAVKLDGNGTTANFGEDGSLVKGDAVERVRKAYASREPLPFFGIEIPDGSTDPNADMGREYQDDEKVSEDLLGRTGLGRQAKDKAKPAAFGDDQIAKIAGAAAAAAAAAAVAAMKGGN